MKATHCIYHWSGEIRIIETEEYNNLLNIEGWFDNPTSAYLYKYLHIIKTWTVRQACFFLGGHNPDPISKTWPSEAKIVKNIMDQDFLLNKINLSSCKNIDGKDKLIADNTEFIRWALTRNEINLSTEINTFYNTTKADNPQTAQNIENNSTIDDQTDNSRLVLKSELLKAKNEHRKNESKRKPKVMAIHAILIALKKIDPSFNPKQMPGTVQEFYDFCSKLEPAIFPTSTDKERKKSLKEIFRECCKGKNMRQMNERPLCGWVEKNVKEAPAIWQKLLAKLTA